MNHINWGQMELWRSRLQERRSVKLGVMFGLLLIALISITLLAQAATNPVLCLTAIRGADNVPHVVYQTQERTREEVMQADGLGHLIDAGYSVLDETCFATWQEAADHFTDGEVILPDNATEMDMVLAVRKWATMKQDQSQ